MRDIAVYQPMKMMIMMMMTMMMMIIVVNDLQLDYTLGAFNRIPWKSIALAIFLLFLGSLLLFLSYFIFTGHMGGKKSQAYGLLALAIINFLPGFYETQIACFSWKGAQGYRFASIPDY